MPGQTYMITAQCTDAEKGAAIESTLALYDWNGPQWMQEPTSTVNTTSNTITATPNHLSLWAVLGETICIARCPIAWCWADCPPGSRCIL